MKNVCMVNGSLRGKKAASLEFLRDLEFRLPDAEFNKKVMTLKAKLNSDYPADILKVMAGADAVVFSFPLHNYGLPGALMRLLEDYYRYIQAGNDYNKSARIYMIVNCGFPRPEATTGEAIRVIRNFCRRLSLNWRFAVCIGTGPIVALTRKIPFLYPKLKKAYSEIASDIKSDDKETRKDYRIKPVIPEAIIARIKRHYEKSGKMIEKNYNDPKFSGKSQNCT